MRRSSTGVAGFILTSIAYAIYRALGHKGAKGKDTEDKNANSEDDNDDENDAAQKINWKFPLQPWWP